jgi:hypothetical protein
LGFRGGEPRRLRPLIARLRTGAPISLLEDQHLHGSQGRGWRNGMNCRTLRNRHAFLGLMFAGACVDPGAGERQAQYESLLTDEDGVLSATLQVNGWDSGYCANVTVANSSRSPVASWRVGIDLAGTSLTTSWCTAVAGAGAGGAIAASPLAYNSTVPAGGRVYFGFCASGGGKPSVTFVEGGGGRAADAGVPRDAGADGGAPVDAGFNAGGDAGSSSEKCENALVCDDFETYPLGGKPGSPWSTSLSNDLASIAIDGTRAHSGSRSVKVSVGAGSGYKSAMLAYQGSKLPVSGNVVFGRMMFWLDSAPKTSVHWTFIDGYGLLPGKDYHAFYRYGGQHPVSVENGLFMSSQLMANYETPDIFQSPPVGIGTDCWLHSDKKMVPVGGWVCAEWRFDGSANKMQFWLDGVELSDLEMKGAGQGCSQQSADFPWTAPIFERIDVGWESYQADEARTLWIDDVVIGTERIGCPGHERG